MGIGAALTITPVFAARDEQLWVSRMRVIGTRADRSLAAPVRPQRGPLTRLGTASMPQVSG